MLQTTIKTALFGIVEGNTLDDGHVIYIIKEDNTIFYIGHSIDPLQRLEEHMGGDLIGDLIRHFAPHSLSWQFEMLTFADCAQFLEIEKLDEANKSHRERVERVLIQRYHPCCNRANNPNPSPLPDKYKEYFRIEAGLTDNLF